MATASPMFLRLWRNEGIRLNLLSKLDTESVCSLRLTNAECCQSTTSDLFTRVRLTFTPSSLTRPSRLEALSRIGHHIQHLTFSMPHTEATFLPPLLNPLTGQEVNFLYTPQTSTVQRPKYGTPELGDFLTQQYPPIFHAATNVPAFIKAMSYLPKLRHLTISCPGQDPAQRYRRDAVDYALISLRIALERASLPRFEKLSLSQIHPAGLLYLRHSSGFGCTPSASRRWKQIRKLHITMDSWDFQGSSPGLDHLKILDDYIRAFSANLEKVSFGWNGKKGPCPLTLFTDPLFSPPKETAKLFCEVTSPNSPLPAAPPRAPLLFPKLRYMQLRNATMTSEQVSEFVFEHRGTVREFDFESVVLLDGGSWDEALAPLATNSAGDEWLSQQSGSESGSFSSFPSHDDLYDQFLDGPEVIDTLSQDIREVPLSLGAEVEVEVEVLDTSMLVTKQKKRHVRRKRRKHRDKSSLIDGQDQSTPPRISTGLLQPTVFDPNVQGVQRNVQQEAAQQELADDPEKRVSTLKKAKEAVLKQLVREFGKSHEPREKTMLFKNTCSVGWKSRGLLAHESTSALVPLMFSRC